MESEPETKSSPTVLEPHDVALRNELRELLDVVGPPALVDLLLERAIGRRATDIHMDPSREGMRVRLRVDGLLHDVLVVPSDKAIQMISRIKILAGMNITERRITQDGHFETGEKTNRRVDIRVGTGPSVYGERLVLRLMPDTSVLQSIDDIGFLDEQAVILRDILKVPYGLLLVCGPVGSGKSTTVYSCLNELNDPRKSLVTIEDPVERRIDGVIQIQVQPGINFGFAPALRGVLRQDPDILMVGEIRDADTAAIACRAALTGALVLSTIHANNTISAIEVLRGFGIPPLYIADALQGIVSQRLLRRVCATHQAEHQPDEVERHALGLSTEEAAAVKLVKGIPHDSNFNTGYSGRTAITEVLKITDDLRTELISDECDSNDLRRIARQEGFLEFEEVAKRKVLAGITTVSEMHRIVMYNTN
jgi:type II secretory ATPase GspE/PulE/Tfp pilus assembly ATPase PilB-like protein